MLSWYSHAIMLWYYYISVGVVIENPELLVQLSRYLYQSLLLTTLNTVPTDWCMNNVCFLHGLFSGNSFLSQGAHVLLPMHSSAILQCEQHFFEWIRRYFSKISEAFIGGMSIYLFAIFSLICKLNWCDKIKIVLHNFGTFGETCQHMQSAPRSNSLNVRFQNIWYCW